MSGGAGSETNFRRNRLVWVVKLFASFAMTELRRLTGPLGHKRTALEEKVGGECCR